ncbi:MAG: helix-turn-helix domain-containing protein [Amphiplicatus sp.]
MIHPLKDYIVSSGDSIAGFARRIGVSRQSVFRIIAGRQTPKPALARRIVEATGGAVSFETFYGARVADLSARRGEEGLNPDLLALVLRYVLGRVVATPAPLAPAMIDAAAEAVVNTHAALSKITTRRGPDRLAQALRPVLEEIRKEYPELRLRPERLDEAANAAGDLYFGSEPLIEPN